MTGIHYPNLLLNLLLLMFLKYCWTDTTMIIYLIIVINVFMDALAKAFILLNTNTNKIGLKTWALSCGFARLRQSVVGLLVDQAGTHISLNCLITPAQQKELSSHFPSSLRFSTLNLQMNNTDRLPVAIVAS